MGVEPVPAKEWRESLLIRDSKSGVIRPFALMHGQVDSEDTTMADLSAQIAKAARETIESMVAGVDEAVGTDETIITTFGSGGACTYCVGSHGYGEITFADCGEVVRPTCPQTPDYFYEERDWFRFR